MHVALVLLPVFGPLAVAASKLERGLEGDPAASTPASFGDRTALYERWPQIGSIPVNRTEGMLRGEKRQPKNLLEARQPDVCADPGFILVCPISDPYPCCPSRVPLCCHTAICCPTGTFCVGEKSCCDLRRVACGEGCCPEGTTCCGGNACCTSGFTCADGKCQSTEGTNSTTTVTPDPAIMPPIRGNPTYTPKKTNNAAVISGAVRGTIGGFILIGGSVATWYL